MKHLKLYEDFSFPGYGGEKIEINKESFSKLNDLLFDEDLNPYFDLFNEEQLYLDDMNNFIGIYDKAEEEDFDYIDMMILNNFIRDYLVEKDTGIIIGSFHFEDYSDVDAYKKKVKSQEFNL